VTIKKLWQVAGVAGVCLIVVLSLIPGSYRPHTGAPGGFEHVLAYALTAMALAMGWRTRSQHLRIVVGLFVLASALELTQLFVPGRSADWGTPITSGLGGVGGIMLAAVIFRRPASAPSGEAGLRSTNRSK